jgi:hypothetical protein
MTFPHLLTDSKENVTEFPLRPIPKFATRMTQDSTCITPHALLRLAVRPVITQIV